MPRKEAPPEERHSRQFVIRLTDDQYGSLAQEARGAGIPLAAYARQALISRKVTVEMPIVLDASDIRPAVVQLARAGNNLNQIAHWLNWHDYADDGLRRQTLDALAEIREAARALTAMADGMLPKRRR